MPGRTSKSTSSSATDTFILSEAVVELGKRLTKELDLDSGNDTLGKWMAHHIAVLMMEAKNVTGAKRNIIERQCADTILKLWSHRASFQSGRRPLVSFEPIFKTLEKIFNKRKRFYFSEPSTEDNEWLKLAEATDDVARLIIRFSLAMASEQAGSREKDWLRLASQLNIQTDLEANLIKKLLEDSQGQGGDAQKPHQGTERLKRFQEKLSAFQNIIKELSKTIDNTLTQTNNTERTLSQETRPRRESRPRRRKSVKK